MKIYSVSHTGIGRDFRFRSDDSRLRDLDAVTLAAQILARREFGRRCGVARITRLDSWAQDGSSSTYESFIGRYDRKTRTVTGHNVWLTQSVIST